MAAEMEESYSQGFLSTTRLQNPEVTRGPLGY
jgi:hypothetical protein